VGPCEHVNETPGLIGGGKFDFMKGWLVLSQQDLLHGGGEVVIVRSDRNQDK
jgi:hypothetical protein